MSAATDEAGARWRSSWTRIGGHPPAGALERLIAAYGEAHRAYHTLPHVLDCLRRAEEVRGELSRPAELEIALWYHDAVYDPRRGDNEARSAALAHAELAGALPPEALDRIAALILATRHPSRPQEGDEQRMVDIDLAILGADRDRFAAYEAGVRREYAWVPSLVFRWKRAKFLWKLARQGPIYHTRLFRDRYEATARRNIRWSLGRLARPW